MKRREFVHMSASAAGLTLLSIACELLPRPTPERMPRIGYLSPGPREAMTSFVAPFLDGLRDLGYVEGQTITIEWRFTPAGSDALFPELAAELVRLPVDVIVARATAVYAARQATTTIPIVTLGSSNPVKTGLVASLARPGANLTGMSANTPGLTGKRLELVREVVPGLTRLACLVDPTSPTYDIVDWDDLRTAAQQAGIRAERIDLRSPNDVAAALEAAVSSRADAIFDLQNPLLLPVRDRFAALALQHRLPGMLSGRDYVASGLLMSYTANFPAIQRRAAAYVDKIVKGAKPADLPIEQPTTFDFFVNVKTAQALGLTIPPDVAAQVTEWIQ